MGRELRRVPPHWEHPKVYNKYTLFPKKWDHVGKMDYKPMRDEDYKAAADSWICGFALWLSKAHEKYDPSIEFWEAMGGPPERMDYTPYKEGEATWFQVYETITMGTPLTPPFETRRELSDHLCEKGDTRSGTPWDRESADEFVEEEDC